MIRTQMDENNSTGLPNEVKPSSSVMTDAFDFKNMINSLPNLNHRYEEAKPSPNKFHAFAENEKIKLIDVLHKTDEFSSSPFMQPLPTNFYPARGSFGNPSTSHVTEETTNNVSSMQSEDRDALRQKLALTHFQQRQSARVNQVLLSRARERLNKMNSNRKLLVNKEQSESPKKKDVFDVENLRNSLPTLNHQSVKVSRDSQNFERSDVQKLIHIKSLLNMRRDYIRAYRMRELLKKNGISPNSYLGGPSTSQATAESTVSNRGPQGYFEQPVPRLTIDFEKLEKKLSVSRQQGNFDPRRAQYHRHIEQLYKHARLRKLENLRLSSESGSAKAEKISLPQKNNLVFCHPVMKKTPDELMQRQIAASIFRFKKPGKELP